MPLFIAVTADMDIAFVGESRVVGHVVALAPPRTCASVVRRFLEARLPLPRNRQGFLLP
jgi:hypothetical protein